MALPSVTLTSTVLSPSIKTVLCNKIPIRHQRNLISNPNANGTAIVEVQTQSYPNPRYTLQNISFTGGSSVLTYNDCVLLTKLQYDGSNAPVLTVNYGKPGNTQVLADSSQSTTGIKVVVESFSADIDTTMTKGGYLPMGTLVLVETV